MKSFLLNKIRLKLKLSDLLNSYLVKNFPTFFFPPHMSHTEFILFKNTFKNKRTIIEFGSGGSTFYFTDRNKRLLSVENNLSFIQYLHSFHHIKDNIKKNNLSVKYIDTGESLAWGLPKNDEKKENWPSYYEDVWHTTNLKPDAIFIDGRFRVMCALQALEYINSTTPVVIHDFLNRPYYHVILDFYKIIAKADTLVVLQKKEIVDELKLNKTKKELKYDYR